MAPNTQKKSSSLLDALDQTFMRSSSPAPVQTPLQRDPLQTPKPEAGSSSKKDALEMLMRAQAAQTAGMASREYLELLSIQDLKEKAESDLQFINSFVDTPQSLSGPLRGEFNLNYDKETPVRPIDVGGPDQEQRLADFVTRAIENTSDGLTVREAMKNLGLREMLEKERGRDKGGILADDMGLGKTVQMIATMAMNMPKHDDGSKTTLIVVPAALLQQWKDEIDTKTNGLFEVHLHHGKDKLKSLSALKSKDIVVTSYQTLCQDFNVPKGTPPDEEAEWIAANGGLLSKAKFYRVIADEAQFIRNRATRSSISLAHIKAKYRWMLTGTPVTNTLADLYGLLRFGRFRPWNDWNDFNDHVAKMQHIDAVLAGSRAQAILKPILFRRTKDSELEGKPLLQLPEKHIEIVKLQFTPDERQVYDLFEKRTKIQINRFLRSGTVLKNHAFILVLMLRLRQICCHPALVLALGEDFEDPSAMMGNKAEKEISRAKKVLGVDWVKKIKQKFLMRATTSVADFEDDDEEAESQGQCSNCGDLFAGDNGRILACGHEICEDCASDLANSPIGHNGIFGYGSEKENLEVEKAYEAAVAKGYRPCPDCKKMMDMTPDKMFHSSAFEPTEDEVNAYQRSKRSWNTPLFGDRKPKVRDVPARVEVKKETSSLQNLLSLSDAYPSDSDDDLPDPDQIHASMFKKKAEAVKKEEPGTSKSSKRKVLLSDSEDDDSDVEVVQPGRSTGSKSQTHVKSESHDGKRRRSNTAGRYSPSPSSSPPRRDTKGKGKAGDSGPSEAVIATWTHRDDDLEPSSKMNALLGYLKEWDSTGDKVICYSQWTSMLDLIEKLLSRHGIRSLRFDGTMDRAHRDATLAEFKKSGGPRIILISTKCGSVGLNLVAANRIVNMDLSWNYASEAQAYDRCHRIGQEKEVFVKRLVVEDTIEDRMLRLQDVKTGLAEAALGEGSGAKLHKLSVKDIRYLFGMKDPEQEGVFVNTH
ncbi:hypothetical protein D9613_003624 [Agrocybe pediades]|uniref:Uncharacterized protein n=1 Tax=Agrocybe pediades TaxID=84607 RepID=A0A8H4VI85_9AGAR|nr:hypothetical protein D9613_003624 [Agrocybe pediades]